MTRTKVKLAYITNDTARNATFKKRKKGLMKKVHELSTLCGIQACAIIYSSYDSQPEVWPSPIGVQQVLSNFKDLSDMDQSKKMVNQESFLRQRIAKINEQLKKQIKENHDREMMHVMFECLRGVSMENFNLMDLNEMVWLIERYLKDIYKRIDLISKAPPSGSGSVEKANHMGSINGDNAQMEKQQWVMEFMNLHDQHVGFGGNNASFWG